MIVRTIRMKDVGTRLTGDMLYNSIITKSAKNNFTGHLRGRSKYWLVIVASEMPKPNLSPSDVPVERTVYKGNTLLLLDLSKIGSDKIIRLEWPHSQTFLPIQVTNARPKVSERPAKRRRTGESPLQHLPSPTQSPLLLDPSANGPTMYLTTDRSSSGDLIPSPSSRAIGFSGNTPPSSRSIYDFLPSPSSIYDGPANSFPTRNSQYIDNDGIPSPSTHSTYQCGLSSPPSSLEMFLESSFFSDIPTVISPGSLRERRISPIRRPRSIEEAMPSTNSMNPYNAPFNFKPPGRLIWNGSLSEQTNKAASCNMLHLRNDSNNTTLEERASNHKDERQALPIIPIHAKTGMGVWRDMVCGSMASVDVKTRIEYLQNMCAVVGQHLNYEGLDNSLCQAIVTGLKDPDSRVREEACKCLASASGKVGTSMKEHCPKILDLLIQGILHPGATSKRAALLAAEPFLRNEAPASLIEQHFEKLMRQMLFTLNEPLQYYCGPCADPDEFRSIVFEIISSVIKKCPNIKCDEYLNELIPHIRTFLNGSPYWHQKTMRLIQQLSTVVEPKNYQTLLSNLTTSALSFCGLVLKAAVESGNHEIAEDFKTKLTQICPTDLSNHPRLQSNNSSTYDMLISETLSSLDSWNESNSKLSSLRT